MGWKQTGPHTRGRNVRSFVNTTMGRVTVGEHTREDSNVSLFVTPDFPAPNYTVGNVYYIFIGFSLDPWPRGVKQIFIRLFGLFLRD